MLNVFIDTQVFVKNNFNFNSGMLDKLKSNVERGLLEIFITDVVKKEVENKISKQVLDGLKKGINSFQKDGRILRNLEAYNLLFEIQNNLDDINNELQRSFEKFLLETNTTVIHIDSIKPSDVFNKYFLEESPFSSKKKNEFPDAFSVLALESYFNEKRENVKVISDDEDLKRYCESSKWLTYGPSLEYLYDFLIESDDYRKDLIINIYDNDLNEIKEMIEETFLMHHFELLNKDGELNNIEVNFIELDEDPYIIEIAKIEGENGVVANIAFNALINFNADVKYLDYENSYYDKEEGKYLFEKYIEHKIEDYIEVEIVLEVSIDLNTEEIIIDKLEINGDNYIGVYLKE